MATLPIRLVVLVLFCFSLLGAARADPAPVTIGVYVNKIQDLSFRENRFNLDFYIWFRWKAEGLLADYKPLESFELMNGKVEDRGSVVEKKIGEWNYASARIGARISNNWELRAFPFDSHRLQVQVEDSQHVASELVFVADTTNSQLGDEIDLSGWNAGEFIGGVEPKVYKSNYGDISLPTDALSAYSRYTFRVYLTRDGPGYALKLLTTVLAATGVAFVAFLVKPTDLDPRFGLGVGALFAVAASAFIVSSSVPDSGVMTVADYIHMIALISIFSSLLQSAFALKLEVSGREGTAKMLDRVFLVVLPALFFGLSALAIWRAMR